MLNETIQAGLNNPDCAFFVGSYTGAFLSIKYLVLILIIYAVMKFLDKLAFDPFIDYIKNKFKKRND